MSKHGNLFLVINLGCEMLYIIDQRLNAQNVPIHRGTQVLTDITGVLFNEELLNELSASKYLGSPEYIRTLLEDIASVSIMRLDPFSMNKLWELMTMVFKWQVTLTEPQNLVSLTKRHLKGVLKIIRLQEVSSKVNQTIKIFEEINKRVLVEELTSTRNAILFWLSDFRTKVSLLLKLGFQRNDGSFIIFKTPENIYVQSLGSNIYINQDDCIESQDNSTSEIDNIPELSFMLNILENKEYNGKRIKFQLLPKENCELGKKNISTNINKIQYTQSKSWEPNTDKITTTVEGMSSNQSTSLHEDLINMLDSKMT